MTTMRSSEVDEARCTAAVGDGFGADVVVAAAGVVVVVGVAAVAAAVAGVDAAAAAAGEEAESTELPTKAVRSHRAGRAESEAEEV